MFQLSGKSIAKLVGVHPGLVSVVKRAIEITEVDFGVGEGIRELARQEKLVAAGKSKTMNSKHLIQPDGRCHAVDLWAYLDGHIEWSMPFYYKIAQAMRDAAIEQEIALTWGCVWDRDLRDLTLGTEELDDDVDGYIARRKAKGARPFLDGPHFEVRQP